MTKKESLIRAQLPQWYMRHQRKLPWRTTKSPYRIWVSEIMLQQTQVSRVLHYYPRFLVRFPTLTDLSQASWGDVLPLWRGLGYYGRGQNMLKTAKILMRQYGGRFPNQMSLLQALPGVGKYTASAIVAFSFRKSVPAIDTNIQRVLGRVYGCPENGVEPRAKALFDHQDPGKSAASHWQLNHALMDLGALVCKNKRVLCLECPLRKVCHFYQSGTYRTLEKKQKKSSPLLQKRKMSTVVIDVGVACIHRKGRFLIAKRSVNRGGLWEFPGGKREKQESIRHCLKREAMEELGIEISVRPPFFIEQWQEKELTWRLHFCRAQILSGTPKKMEHSQLKWVKGEELKNYKFPQANARAIAMLLKRGG